MSTNSIASRTRHLSAAAAAHGSQIFWTVAVVSIEMITIVACTFAAYLAYSAVAYGVVFFRSDYVLASIGVGSLYVALCIADNQYDRRAVAVDECRCHARGSSGHRQALCGTGGGL